MTTNPWSRSAVRELEPDDCMELVRTARIGRIGFVDGRGPTIFPVNFTVYGESILISTSPYGSLAASTRHDWVAFEVDQIDQATESGWSVLLRGPLERAHAEELPLEVGVRPVPWAEGSRNLLLRMTPVLVTGRRLRGP